MSYSSRALKTSVAALCLAFAAAAAIPPAEAAQKHPTPATAKAKKKAPAYVGGPKAAIVIDGASGVILHEDHADARREPASLTKLVTAMVVFDALRDGRLHLDDILPLADSSKVAAQGAVTLKLPVKTQISVHNLLEALAIRSAADATITLAKAVAGDEKSFIDLMNAKAKEIGANDTHFANPHGMPDKNQYTTAHDMARIMQYMMKTYTEEYAYFGKTSFTINTTLYPGHNALLVNYKCKDAAGAAYPCMEAGKTGFFTAAGFAIAASSANDGRRVITVVMGERNSTARNAKVAVLTDQGFKKLEDMNAPRIPDLKLPVAPVETPTLIPELGPDDYKKKNYGVESAVPSGPILTPPASAPAAP